MLIPVIHRLFDLTALVEIFMIGENLILTVDELNEVDFKLFSQVPLTFHEHEISAYLRKIQDEAVNENEKKVAEFLSILFMFNLQVVGGNSVFEPMAMFGNKRSLLPEDFDSKLNDYIIELSTKITNPFFLSRICDVIWINNKAKKDIAIKAIESYSEMIGEAISHLKRIKKENDNSSLSLFIFIKEYIARALFISSCVYPRKSGGNEHIITAITSLYETQNELLVIEGFNNLTWVMMQHSGDKDKLKFAVNAESMAKAHTGKTYFEAVKALYETAARIYEKNSKKDEAKQCRISAAKITIDVVNSHSEPMLKASWLRTAISELRNLGEKELIEDLKKQLVDAREESLNSYAALSSPIDITDEVNNSLANLANRKLSFILKYIMRETPIENISNIREEVLRISEVSIFSRFFASEIMDEAGRRIHRDKPLSDVNEMTDDEAIDHYMRNITITHDLFIKAVFEPARFVIIQEHNLTLNTFTKFAECSPFIKDEHANIFSLGFYRLFQGDYMGASYLLIPQMEGIIRHAYELSGKDSTRYLDKGIEESTSISILLDKCREDIDLIFTKDIALTIDMLFNRKNGPVLRHKLAHGNLYDGMCFSESTIYACFLIFYICALPLYAHFERIFD